MIKSPLNYIGGKSKLLPQILPLFPDKINTFVDLFAGGCNVGININANKIIFNDNLIYLIEMYQAFQQYPIEYIINHIENRIQELELSLSNQSAYLKLRELYNNNRQALDLFVLIAYSFNHQIRFNNNHQFNNPFGKERSSFNDKMRDNLLIFLNQLKQKSVEFSAKNFDEFDFSSFGENDLIYCDPPYLITTGVYNDGKRGFKGWNNNEEQKLLNLLDNLTQKNIRFALSNVLEHKGNENELLKQWIKNNRYFVHYLDFNYANSSYQNKNRNKDASCEVLITNYQTNQPINQTIQYELAI